MLRLASTGSVGRPSGLLWVPLQVGRSRSASRWSVQISWISPVGPAVPRAAEGAFYTTPRASGGAPGAESPATVRFAPEPRRLAGALSGSAGDEGPSRCCPWTPGRLGRGHGQLPDTVARGRGVARSVGGRSIEPHVRVMGPHENAMARFALASVPSATASPKAPRSTLGRGPPPRPQAPIVQVEAAGTRMCPRALSRHGRHQTGATELGGASAGSTGLSELQTAVRSLLVSGWQ